MEKAQRFGGPGNQSSRNGGASTAAPAGQVLQKLCTRIQKETCKTIGKKIFSFISLSLATNITFFNKDQTLIVTITGRPEQVRAAQVQILRELQQPVKLAVNVPFEYHRYIIGPRAVTLKQLEQETLTRIAIPGQETQSNTITIAGAKDNVKLAEQRILAIYQTQFNKGYERLMIPCLYHPWIRHHLVKDLKAQLNVTIDLPPPIKQTDEVSIRGERQPVEEARARIMQFYQSLVMISSKGREREMFIEINCVLGRENHVVSIGDSLWAASIYSWQERSGSERDLR